MSNAFFFFLSVLVLSALLIITGFNTVVPTSPCIGRPGIKVQESSLAGHGTTATVERVVCTVLYCTALGNSSVLV